QLGLLRVAAEGRERDPRGMDQVRRAALADAWLRRRESGAAERGAPGSLPELYVARHHPLQRRRTLNSAHRRCAGLRRALRRRRKRKPPMTQQAIDDANRALNQGRIDDAERLLRSALQRDPQSADAHVALGSLLARKDQHAEATESYANAMRIDRNRL